MSVKSYSESDLEAMNKTQLLELAERLGIEGLNSKSLKADMVTAILEAM